MGADPISRIGALVERAISGDHSAARELEALAGEAETPLERALLMAAIPPVLDPDAMLGVLRGRCRELRERFEEFLLEVEDANPIGESLKRLVTLLDRWPDAARCAEPIWLDVEAGDDPGARLAATLVRHVYATRPTGDEVEALCRQIEGPALEGLTELSLWAGEHHNEEAAALAGALTRTEHATRLSTLRLHDTPLADPVGTHLLARARMPQLTNLDLSYAEYLDEEHAALIGERFHLRALDLEGNLIGDAGVAHLCRGAAMTGLEELGLRQAGVTGEGVEELGRSSVIAELRRLDLGYCAIGSRGLAALRGLEGLCGLDELSLETCGLGPAAASVLANDSTLACLRHLDLSGNRLGPEGLALLLSAPRLAELRTLDLGDNDLRDAGLERLASCPSLANLERLNLSDNRVSSEAVQHVRASPHFRGEVYA